MKTRNMTTEQKSSEPLIKLSVNTQEGESVYFKVPRASEISKLLRRFCRRKTIEYDSAGFFYDGERVSEKQTPDDLGMEDNDEIDATREQIGGCFVATDNTSGYM